MGKRGVAMTVKISISISEQQAAYARKQVEEGRFSSTSAVIQQALEAKRREDEEYEAWKSGFFDMLDARAQEQTVDRATFARMVDDMIREERAKFGLEG
jgi:antitoxin ParD1/3/4